MYLMLIVCWPLCQCEQIEWGMLAGWPWGNTPGEVENAGLRFRKSKSCWQISNILLELAAEAIGTGELTQVHRWDGKVEEAEGQGQKLEEESSNKGWKKKGN